MERRFDKDSELLIDALRGIAALLVLFTHAFDLAVSEAYGWSYESNPENWRWARASLGHGGFWVWCFFMISGVCIHQSIARSIAKGEFSAWRYAVARVTRVYPLFLLGLALAILAWYCHKVFGEGFNETPWRELMASLFSLHILTTPFPAYETSWSLSCEMFYYALWPTLLILSRGRVAVATTVSMALVLLMTGAIMILWKVFHQLEQSTLVEGVWIVTVLFPVWVCGAWLADHWNGAQKAISQRTWLFSILLCVLSECLLVVLKFKQYPSWALHLAGLSSIPGLMLFLSGARYIHLSFRPWAEPVCRWLGQLSYPCYILHMQLLLLLDYLLEWYAADAVHQHPLWHALIEFVVVFGLLVGVGPWLERVTMRWRSGLLASMGRTTRAVAS